MRGGGGWASVALLVALGCGGDGDVFVEGEPEALAGITAAHNAVRAEVGVGPLRWDDRLAAIAQGWAQRCRFEHNQGRSDSYGSYVGENIYMAGGFSPSGQDVVDSWASEKADYDYASNTCRDVCGHYTQIVWADTTAVGCGLARCAGTQTLVVCDYAPGGNYVGERPY